MANIGLIDTLSIFFLQAKLRLEMEMERLRQTHSKDIESKDDEVEEIRQSCSKKVMLHLHSSRSLM